MRSRRPFAFCAGIACADALARMPARVGDWAVEPICSTWDDTEVCCLVASSDPDADDLGSVAHPDHPRSRAFSELGDPHGALGVWPAAYAATTALAARAAIFRGGPPRVLELGCGAGLPSLYASVVLESPRVLATDVEDVPLEFLEAARAAHGPPAPGSFATALLDVSDSDALALIGDFDVVVAADLLYDADVAASLGGLLGRAVANGGLAAIVADPGRRGRDAFLDAFIAASGSPAAFVDAETRGAFDVFDGTPQASVGVLEVG